ncbi:hypothetical protein SAMN02745172_03668 [Pseudoxanthobacter soli DSM 19599]|uniref:Uncharacterized protein n=1 Tax=Pseudoxanthobacter soli DSM 19599 TaxID=1123029 RepID=A0A1M7ZQT2_9HYPH|nr:hypothetical protein [Pseudoxanthobacter soli]SHO67006.1 hypothetical protein SAMN02745172_03668 [Pseudoxanthobacter soli DSM 19599]
MDEPSVAFSVEGKTFRSPIGVFSVLGICALVGAILCLLQIVTRPFTLSDAIPMFFGGVGGVIGLAAGLGFTTMHFNAWRAGRNADAAARRITPLVIMPGGILIDPYPYAGSPPLGGQRRRRFVRWRDVTAIGSPRETGLFPVTVAEKDGIQKTVYEIPEKSRADSGELARAALVAARERYLAGLSSATQGAVGTFFVPVIRTAPPIWRSFGGGAMLAGAAGFALLLAATAASVNGADLDLTAFLGLLAWSVLIAVFALVIVFAAISGWQARGKEISWPVATIEADGFTATSLPNAAGDLFGDLKGRSRRVAWPEVRRIEPPVAGEHALTIDIGQSAPLRLPAVARAEDGRTLHPALAEAWQAWRNAS